MSDDEDLREVVRDLREEVDALHRRLDELETRVESDSGAGDASGDAPAGGDTPADVDTGRSTDDPAAGPVDHAADGEATARDGTPADRPGVAEPPTADRDTAPDADATGEGGRDWEDAVGVRWLGLAGALAVVVGVVFFVRLAIERGLLGPFGRVTVGTVGGLMLFAVGRYAADRQGFDRWGRIAAGAGLAVAYFSLYAAYGFDAYREALGTPLWAVLAALTLLVAATAAVSVRDGAPLVAGEAFLLGYVTAYLSTDAATVVLTPVYALLLAAAVVTIATVKPWRGLAVSSTVATYTVLGLWIVAVDPGRSTVAVATLAAFLTSLAGSYALHDATAPARRDRVLLVSLTATNAVAGSILLEGSLQDAYPDAGVEGLGLAIVAVGLAGLFAATDRRRPRPDHVAGAVAVLVAGAAIRVALAPFATTLGWVALLAAAVAAAHREDAPAVRFGGHVLAAALVGKLLVIDASDLPGVDTGDALAVLTGRPVAFGVAIAALYALAVWFDAADDTLLDAERSHRGDVDAAYAVGATVLVLALLALELSGLGASVAWALFGLVLVAVGLAVDRRGVRALGVGVLGVTTAKVFIYDTSDLDTVARTVSFLVVGAVLLVASYVYARSSGEDGIAFELPGRE